MALASHRSYAGWVTVLRVYAGAFWLSHAVPKFLQPARFMPPNGFFAMAVQKALPEHHGLYHAFLATVVSPNLYVFAELTRLGEALTGLALLLGIFTRFAGLVGCFLALNYFFVLGEFGNWRNIGSLEAAAFMLSFMFLVIPAGRVAGVDAVISRPRTRRETVVTPEVVEEPPAAP